MNCLFLTLLDFQSFSEHNIYCDLLRALEQKGHTVYCISPTERRYGRKTHWEGNGRLLKLRIGNTQKTNIIEKGISTLLIEPQFKTAIRKYFGGIKFDLVLYSTPPITLVSAIRYIKKRDGAATYLMLKDIFPQNAVDLGMFSKKSPIYAYFRRQEEKLYRVSDYIGCMSPANVKYVLEHNPVSTEKVGLCPNAIDAAPCVDRAPLKAELKKKYGIGENAKVFLYGGNLGKPQNISFVISCLKALNGRKDCHFIVCGNGSEYPLLKQFVKDEQPENFTLISFLPKAEYDRLVMGCDVGLIFLDYRFTIPNFPSRLLSYMECEMPVLVCTDAVSDMGPIAEANGFGYYSPGNSVGAFTASVDKMLSSDTDAMGKAARAYLEKHYSAASVCDRIIEVL